MYAWFNVKDIRVGELKGQESGRKKVGMKKKKLIVSPKSKERLVNALL